MKGTEFAELTAFLTVSDERNFRRAAQRLGMSPSALSHMIRSLEERLGARLLNRTTRSVAPTEAGQALFDRLRPAIDDMEGAIRDVGAYQTQPRGIVRVNLPRIAARLVVTPILADFLGEYPEIRLDLVIDDTLTDVVAKGFDAGIRSGELVQQDMIAVRLTPDLRMAVVGSPAYFAGRALPEVPRDIRDHRCITYRWSETGVLYRWSFDGPGGSVDVDVDSIVTANDTDLLLAAALQGAGLAFTPESFVAPYIESGELVRVLEPWCKPFSGFYLYYPNRPRMPLALRAFIDFIKFRNSLERQLA
ncbi:LysR family transcriptional regulator [Labrys wisconsinensis]|uniref:DNA-binding transcriptional LysR family regulator n=1 Tax=Labrys wisconsinensis TaxID=425677 RepID=A0ABU0JD10_9HYPH|nr:LysR family transcriptional regulator [Labrys wisconsinensis]MDQ0472161.1 DNA-binding transcriptional LysR family regulator [Labrys wisconsinensis]